MPESGSTAHAACIALRQFLMYCTVYAIEDVAPLLWISTVLTTLEHAGINLTH